VNSRQNPASPTEALELTIGRDEQEPVFREPWEAHAFALVVMLHEQGLFTWPEWTFTLATEIEHAQATGDPDTGETYYHHWLAALERLVADRGFADQITLARYRDAWARAAERTPHGTPIELAPHDLASGSRQGASGRRI
jgi:nitrile hydratase accessory protein